MRVSYSGFRILAFKPQKQRAFLENRISFILPCRPIDGPFCVLSHSYSTMRMEANDLPAALQFSKLQILKSPDEASSLPPLERLRFGTSFSDHMVEIEWDIESGWDIPIIRRFSNISLHPASSVLHYGLEVFEGLKAFRLPDSSIAMFRPDMNVARLNRSAKRMCLPGFDEAELLKIMAKLVQIDSKFVPDREGYSLYLRPMIFSTQATLGVSPPLRAKLMILCSPTGPYFTAGFKPIKLWADTDHIRAWPGGVGECKTGANYGPTILPQQEAMQQNCSSILWLLPTPDDDFFVTEAGVMNVFVHWLNEDGISELATFPLEDNLILPGVTRDSLLQLAHKIPNLKVTERRIKMKADILKALQENRIYELFGSGTACAISPVDCISFMGQEFKVPLGQNDVGKNKGIGPLSERLLNNLRDIQLSTSELQYGRAGPHPWCFEVEKVLSECEKGSEFEAIETTSGPCSDINNEEFERKVTVSS